MKLQPYDILNENQVQSGLKILSAKGLLQKQWQLSVKRGFRKNMSGEAIKERITNPVIIPAIIKRITTYRHSKEVKRIA